MITKDKIVGLRKQLTNDNKTQGKFRDNFSKDSFLLLSENRLISVGLLNTSNINKEEMRGSEGSNELERKRVQIRKKIRRDYLDNYFEERRRELLASDQTSSPNNQREQLETEEQRHYFLEKINNELNQRPNNQWMPLVEELQKSLSYFQGNFAQFTSFKIIELLASVVCQNQYRLKIQHCIMKIFTQIVNRQTVNNPAILEKIILTNIIETSINYMQSVDMPFDQQYCFLHFYASIARINERFRAGMLQHGAGRLIVTFATRLLETNEANEQLRFSLLGICSDFLFQFPQVRSVRLRYPSIIFVEPILPLIIAFLSEGGSERITKMSLICLMLIAKIRNQSYFKKIFQSNIVPYLFKLTKVPMFSFTALNIISNLASSYADQNTQYLTKMGIKDLLYDMNCQEDVDYRVVAMSLNIIDNLLTCRQDTLHSMNHPMWEIICRSLEHREIAVRMEAFHCINAILGFLEDPGLQFQILKKNNFLQLAISQLQDFKKRSPQLLFECLTLLHRYINLSHGIGNPQAFKILQSVYKLPTLLEKMVSQLQNQMVLEKASEVEDCYLQKFTQQQH